MEDQPSSMMLEKFESLPQFATSLFDRKLQYMHELIVSAAWSLDFRRIARFGVTGVGSGLLWTQYYGGVEGLLEALSPPARLLAACLLEQFVWCPALYSFYVIPLSALQNGGRVSDLPTEVRMKLGPLLIANAKVWTPANLIIYSTPLELVSDGGGREGGNVSISLERRLMSPTHRTNATAASPRVEHGGFDMGNRMRGARC